MESHGSHVHAGVVFELFELSEESSYPHVDQHIQRGRQVQLIVALGHVASTVVLATWTRQSVVQMPAAEHNIATSRLVRAHPCGLGRCEHSLQGKGTCAMCW